LSEDVPEHRDEEVACGGAGVQLEMPASTREDPAILSSEQNERRRTER
jgi:hypothetical protein